MKKIFFSTSLFICSLFFKILPASATEKTTFQLPNPLAARGEGPVDTLKIIGILSQALVSAIGFLSLFFMVLGGYQLLISRGNPEKVKAGKATIFWATFGVVLTLLSFVIINLIIRTLTGT